MATTTANRGTNSEGTCASFSAANSIVTVTSSNSGNISTRGDFLHPLSFPEAAQQEADLSHFIYPEKDFPIVCLFSSCEEVFGTQAPLAKTRQPTPIVELKVDNLELENVQNRDSSQSSDYKDTVQKFSIKDQWLRHLFIEHKLVVDRVNKICSLRSYSEYWRKRLSEAPITEFMAVIRTNSTKEECCGPSEDYYMLSDALPEDKELRTRLKLQKLEAVLQVQEKERSDENFCHGCLFCSQIFTGNRSLLFQHMLDSHGFHVGQPDNLVFINEFLDLLQQKLNSLQCLYCERSFRDHPTLKDHMRKKQHKKIDGKNHIYDRFYLINYLEPGRGWEDMLAEDDRDILPQPQEREWDDWKEGGCGSLIFCLFCCHSSEDFSAVLDHMLTEHSFNYHTCVTYFNLDYYGQVKLVNYIRRQVYLGICCYCHQKFPGQEALTAHMTTLGHFKMPVAQGTSSKPPWDQPQFYFPTYENDGFLFSLDDS